MSLFHLPRPTGEAGRGKAPVRKSAMSAQEFVRHYLEGTERLTEAYGYNPAEGSDSCGVGLVVALDGKRRRDVVMAGIDALKAVWHRGAVDADGKTGDGAGLH